MKKITSYTHHITAEGHRLTCTYSEISDEGKVIDSNVRETFVVLDEKMIEHIEAIGQYLQSKI